jgi:uncharacterized hydrophobic protein (TIGR00271 family)
MLHVRVVSPADVTDRLVEALAADSGVSGLVVLRAAATRPHGDAVQFDLATASANSVLRQIRDLGLDRHGSVVVETVDAALSERPDQRASYHGERAPVWELVEARIHADAEYPPSFFALLVFAGLIGACGILTNSQILVVGAMVVGPEYSAIIAVALGLDRRDGHSVRRGLLVLTVGFALAIAVTLVLAACIRASGHTPRAYLAGVRPVSDLINSPNLFSVVVAVIAGLTGVVSLTLAKATALTGVFISVTTIPAAADVGVSLVYGAYKEAVGSVTQLLLNVVLLIVVGALGLHAQRAVWRSWQRRTLPAAAAPATPRPGGCLVFRRRGRLRYRGRLDRDRLVDVTHVPHLRGGEGSLAADVAGEGQPPGEDGAESVPVAGQERDVHEQPGDPAGEAAQPQRSRGDDRAAA